MLHSLDMELLEALKMAFDVLPDTINVRDFLRKKQCEFGSEAFSLVMFDVFCARRYNSFMDYGSMALKISRMFADRYPYYKPLSTNDCDNDESCAHLIVDRLLFDDRHDCYQNVPYLLEDFIKSNIDSFGDKEKDEFWTLIANILITSFNCSGTSDILWKQTIEEV